MLRLVLASILASTLFAVATRAAVVDTFRFDQAGYTVINGGAPVPEMTGSFTGTVEPGGLIELGDLSAFSMTDNSEIMWPLSDLKFFSFNVNGGASSLAVIVDGGNAGEPGNAQVTVCIGAPASLSPTCNPATTPLGDLGYESFSFFVFQQNTPFAFSMSQPSVTLVSSTPVPEPPSVALLGSGLLGLYLIGARLRRRDAGLPALLLEGRRCLG